MPEFVTVESKSDEDYLRLAYQAALSSPDPSTQNGAVLPVYHYNGCGFRKSLVVTGCNTFPVGVPSSPDRLERPLKYQFIEHAERAVILHAARDGYRLHGRTLYCCWYACADCARAIIAAGIVRVVGHKKMADGTPAHWKDSIANAMAMFAEAGVQADYVDGDLGGPPIRFNGAPWQP